MPQGAIVDPMLPVRGAPPVWGANSGPAPSSQASGSSGGAYGAVAGAANGFAMGASTGVPHLAGIGAVVGGIAGLFGG